MAGKKEFGVFHSELSDRYYAGFAREVAKGIWSITGEKRDVTPFIKAIMDRNDPMGMEIVEAVRTLLGNATIIADPAMGGLADCYSVPMDDVEALRKLLSTVD